MKYEPEGICTLRMSGILKRSEFGAEQSALAHKIDIGSKPCLLVILENFEGWERDTDWGNDLDFLFSYSDKIAKIAFCRSGGPSRAGEVFSAQRSEAGAELAGGISPIR